MAFDTSAAIDRMAGQQHGLISTEQALKALGPGRKDRWIQARQLIAIQPRVFRIAGAPQTWHQNLMACQMSTGGIVSHRSAAELWGLIQPAGYVEVSVTTPRTPRAHPPAIVHRIKDLHPELALQRQGLQITDPTRTIIDLGLVLPHWSVRDALSRGLTMKLFDLNEVERLRDVLGRQGRNGTGVVRHLLDERSLGGVEESLLERRLHDLVRTYALPTPMVQHELWHGGRLVARIDVAYPERKLAIEVDGFAYHSSPDAFQRDRTRQNRLVALGWTVLRFTWDDIVQRPAMVAHQIREAINRSPAA